MTTEEVSRFISPPPTTVEGFERFIAWTHDSGRPDRYVCFAVVPHGVDTAIGLFQVRQLEPGFGTAEWGFAIGSPFWGTGVFTEGAEAGVEFAFEKIGVHRLEARAAVANGRGNGALAKIGAVKEGGVAQEVPALRRIPDQAPWSMVRGRVRSTRAVWGSIIH